ncbi:uncharacterized protein GGS25DRAFT_522418 [Hypoxylon fragiforme]|uniref:uncharacterized protein n=1 Tax=Hypoxylon fragiforme TaxID=63214 RepID=UPI0020C695B4|nr:uncharacterized protein GGS25DRAFT_522418 [Hypoxylon fragiforme]KAI2606901.1 hypothetical protein GGS25DRAFT_522418 [Hypoxylon fragiforme]
MSKMSKMSKMNIGGITLIIIACWRLHMGWAGLGWLELASKTQSLSDGATRRKVVCLVLQLPVIPSPKFPPAPPRAVSLDSLALTEPVSQTTLLVQRCL